MFEADLVIPRQEFCPAGARHRQCSGTWSEEDTAEDSQKNGPSRYLNGTLRSDTMQYGMEHSVPVLRRVTEIGAADGRNP